MYGISAVVVTENAQDVIRDCLESVRWAEEIVVVDAGSTDKTIEIVAEYTGRIITVDAHLNSGERWNRGIEAASKNWIFVLESDKRISPSLRSEIDEITKAYSPEEADGYTIKTRNYFLGHWVKMSSFYPDYKLYIFRKGLAKFEERNRGCIIFKGKSKNLSGYIEHHVFRSLEQMFSKANKQSDRLAEELFAKEAIFKKRYLVTKPLRLFKKQYFKHGGLKEGIVGLFLCLFSAFELFLVYAKRWEMEETATKERQEN